MAGNALRLVISISASADSARSVAQRLRFRRSRRGQRASSRNLSLKPWTFSPIKRDETASPPLGPVYATGVAATPVRAMELITILNRCHRFRGFVYQHAYFSADKKSIEVAVRPRKGSAAVCSRCHLPAPGYDQLAERRFEFIPLWGFLVFLLYTMRRVDCRRCGVVAVEEVPWGDGKRTLTKAYMLFLARWARRLSWKETAEAFRTSWDKVFDAVEHVVTWGLEHRTLGQIDAIGVDEIQYSKGHKYLTLVYQIDLGVTRLLWVGKERTIESFRGFFTTIGEEITSRIVFICPDMWEPYLKVIRENCSEALHILDRFHIVAKMNKALDEVRAGESRRMASEGRTPLLKKSRWLLLKREENLKEEQRFRLRDLLRYNLKTVRAYLLKEAFQQLWEYNSPAWAGRFLDEWCRQTMRSRIEPMKKITRSLRQHRELILNYFRAQKLISSGVVEGLNNKAKVTMRKSYGFRTYRVLELALYHSLGKLPEPVSTHDFF
jgi:transposase